MPAFDVRPESFPSHGPRVITDGQTALAEKGHPFPITVTLAVPSPEAQPPTDADIVLHTLNTSQQSLNTSQQSLPWSVAMGISLDRGITLRIFDHQNPKDQTVFQFRYLNKKVVLAYDQVEISVTGSQR